MSDPSVLALLRPQTEYSSLTSDTALNELCKQILGNGLDFEADGKSDATTSARTLAWKIMLGIKEVPAATYLELVQLGPSAVNDKIRNDTQALCLRSAQLRALNWPFVQLSNPGHRCSVPRACQGGHAEPSP